MILKRPSFRRGGNAGIGSLRTGFSNGSPRFINLGGANPKPINIGTKGGLPPQNVPTAFQMGEQRGQNIINKAKNFANKFIPKSPSGIIKALGTARVLTPGLSNPYFLAGAAAVVPPSIAMYQLNEARKRGELLDPVQNPYETDFGVLTQEDLIESPAGTQEKVTVTEEEEERGPNIDMRGDPEANLDMQKIAAEVIPNKKRKTAPSGEKSYETAYDAEVKKLEKLLGKTDYKGEVAIALSDAIGTPGSIADKASALNKQLLGIMGAKKKQKGRIAEIAYDAVNKIKMAEIAAGKQTPNERYVEEARALKRIINDPNSSTAEKSRAEAQLKNLSDSISVLGKGDSIQMRRDKTSMLQQLNSSLFGIKSKKKGKERDELIEQLKAQYKINVGGYPEFKEDFDRIITSAGIEGVDISKFAMGGRVKRALGTPKNEASGAVEMEETVKETVTEGPETPTAPVRKMDYAELRNRLPKEITDDVIQLISKSQEAMQDFAYIRTQGDVDSFNIKYGVNLVLPANT
tara:strand:+ start:133 stop:1689 length:1557 start_codon:yes stop_codon:yes gene_type:complete